MPTIAPVSLNRSNSDFLQAVPGKVHSITTTDHAADVSQSESKSPGTSVIDKPRQEWPLLHHDVFSTVLGDNDVSIEKYFDMLDAVNSSDQLLAAEDIFTVVTTPVVDDYTTDAMARTSEQVKNEHIKGIFEKLLPNKSDAFNKDKVKAEKTTTPAGEVVYETYGEPFEEFSSSKTYKGDSVPHIDPEMYDYEAHSKEVESYTTRSTMNRILGKAQSKISDAQAFTTSFATSVSPTPSEVVEMNTHTEITRDQLLATVVTETYNKFENEKALNSETIPKLVSTSEKYPKNYKEEAREYKDTTASYNHSQTMGGLLENAPQQEGELALSEKLPSSLKYPKLITQRNDNIEEITTTSNHLLSDVNRYNKQNVKEQFEINDILIETSKMLDAKAELEASTKALDNSMLSSTQFETTSKPTTTYMEYSESDIEDTDGSRDKTLNDIHSARTAGLLHNRQEHKKMLPISESPSLLDFKSGTEIVNTIHDSDSTSFIDVNRHDKQKPAHVGTKEISVMDTGRSYDAKLELVPIDVKNPSTLSSLIKIITPDEDIVKNSSLTKQNEESSTLTNESSTTGVPQQTNIYTKIPAITTYAASNAAEYLTTTVRYDSSKNDPEKLITEASIPDKTSRHVRGPSITSLVSGGGSESKKTFEPVTKSILTVEDDVPIKDLHLIQSHQSFSHALNRTMVNSTQNAALSANKHNNERLMGVIKGKHYNCFNISFAATVFKDVSK